MHVITVEFVANTEDAEAVRAAYQPIIDAYSSHEACLGVQLVQNKSRRQRNRFMFMNFWRTREEAMEISSRPEVNAAHDKIYAVSSDGQNLNAWEPISQRGIVAVDGAS
ncbi:MAG: antibiotic biosynthesis monooxygenase [Dehalococcoidia bacterium]